MRKDIDRVKNFKCFLKENIEITNNYLIIGNKKLKVLFGYEDIKSGVINIITNDDGLNIVYEIYNGLEDVKDVLNFDRIWNYDEFPIDAFYANWMGGDATSNIENGIKADYGEIYLGWKRTKKRKLTRDELSDILNKKYKWIHSKIISNAKKRR
jgi:hypothetical protein